MGLKKKEWIKVISLTTTVAAACVSLAAWRIYRNRWGNGCHRKLVYSLAYVGSHKSLPPLSDHTLTAVYSPGARYPKVYAIGGHGSEECMDVWVLDSALHGWTEMLPAANADTREALFTKRSCHAAAGVGSDIYVIGGYTNKTVGDVLKFDTEEERWSTPTFTGVPPHPRSSHSATAVGKKIYVFGGHGGDSPLNDVLIFDTETGSWTTPTVLGFPPAPRYAHSAVLLGERILIYGGYSTTAESDVWFLEFGTPYVQKQEELLGKEVVAWSKGSVGESPQPIVICGPSGVGKGTLIARLMRDYPDHFGFSVSHTTRKPRNMEQDGVHYHFTQRSEMEAGVREGKFLESVEVHGNLYGTSIAAVEAVADAGRRCILDIDVQGAELVKKSPLDALFVFISPPTVDELEARLRLRGTETEHQVQKRLKTAKAEMERSSDGTLFDHLLVNDKIDDTYKQLETILGLEPRALEERIYEHQSLPEARSGHSATILESKVLVFGGLTGEGTPSNDLLVLDTSRLTNGAPAATRGLSWSRPENKFDFWKYLCLSPFLAPRYNHSVVALSSTEILVTGGYDSQQAFSESLVLAFGNG